MTNEVNDREITKNLETDSRSTIQTRLTGVRVFDANDNKYREESADNEYLQNSNLEIQDEVIDFEMSVPTAPDGGWGWVVCFGSFTVNFILDGTMFSFGILMLALLDDLGYDKYTTAWIGSAQMGIHMAIGPVISLVLQYFSIRQVAMAGSIISAAGFIASAFAPNIYVLIFTYGIIGGIGIGMVFLPAILVVGLYFDKKRALATGIATSGSGVGTFIYGYITNIALSYFSWRGTVFILGGLILNCLVCGMCFRPLSLRRRTRSTKFSQVWQDNDRVGCDTLQPLIEESASCTGHTVTFHPKQSQSVMADCLLSEHVSGAGDLLNLTQPDSSGSSGIRKLRAATDVYQASDGAGQGDAFTSNSLRDYKLQNCAAFRDDSGPTDDNKNVGTDQIKSAGTNVVIPGAASHRSTDDPNCETSSTAVSPATNSFSGGDGHLPLAPGYLHPPPPGSTSHHQQTRTSDRKYYSSENIPLVDLSSATSQYKVTSARHCAKSEPKLNVQLDAVSSHIDSKTLSSKGHAIETTDPCQMTDLKPPSNEARIPDLTAIKNSSLCKLLANKSFLLLLLTFSMWTAQSITLTYIPDLAVSLDIQPTDAAFLISIIGIANILGRLLAGIVTDCFHVPSIWLYFFALLVAAGTNLIISFSPLFTSSLVVLQICSAVFGLCMAVAVSMRTIVLADQLGIKALTLSFGVVAMFQGITFSVNPPIAGRLIDDFQSFRPPFVMAAIMYTVSAMATFTVGCISATQSRRQRAKEKLNSRTEC